MANEQLKKLGELIEVEPRPFDERISDDPLNIESPLGLSPESTASESC